ncbi:MAG: TetR/AcrR family transcriptional regulator [Phenylobacterium sp.]|uniref:TetR/AcrR family transcriptional regulator n=1 Tax=Phenylobacterium sp. TaxID=1871053 RepID=UPI002715CC25|nr:TetR/AcrR family transcriptional regulator [Phenylobacterium sp.]MDO8900755.1 TetR/AcrR family transcriptional regulator [Phenylobacterium sp.]MDP2215091.1 TetR/AcrR family transcriptional regulator [Phenylobacterium sp.]
MAWSDITARRRYHVGNLRAQLLEEARAIVEEGGVSHLNLRALAARTGIAAGSVYHHYSGKAELLSELAASGFHDLERRLTEAQASAREGRRIATLARAYFAFSRSDAALFGLMFDPLVAAHPAVEAARDRCFSVLQAAVAVALPARKDSAQIDKITRAVWACGHGAASLRSSDAQGEDELMEDVIQGLELLFGRR